MALSSLGFLQDLYSLEAEISTLLDYAECPEECPELLPKLFESIRVRLNSLITTSISYCLVAEKLELSLGDTGNTSNGLPYVKQLFVESFLVILQRILLQNSQNLSMSRDLLLSLHSSRDLPTSSEKSLSPVESIAGLLNLIDQMMSQFENQQRVMQNMVKGEQDG